jgi:hypothetical protein
MHLWDGFTHIKHKYIKRTKPMSLAISALTEKLGNRGDHQESR